MLDLCCGNGVITEQIAPYVDTIFGIDFSQPLIDVANKRKPGNAHYFLCSVLDGSLARLVGGQKFKKIYMNESLQNFAEHEFDELLDCFSAISEVQALFYVTSIPEKCNLFALYDTEEKRKDYYKRLANGTEIMGTWWEREFLESVAKAKGLSIKTLDQAPDFYSHQYRFDALVGRNITLD